MKDPVSPNQLFVEVQKDVVNLSVPQHTHVHHVEFCQPPNKKSASYTTHEHQQFQEVWKEKNYIKFSWISELILHLLCLSFRDLDILQSTFSSKLLNGILWTKVTLEFPTYKLPKVPKDLFNFQQLTFLTNIYLSSQHGTHMYHHQLWYTAPLLESVSYTLFLLIKSSTLEISLIITKV